MASWCWKAAISRQICKAGPEVIKTVHDQLASGQDLIVLLPAELH